MPCPAALFRNKTVHLFIALLLPGCSLLPSTKEQAGEPVATSKSAKEPGEGPATAAPAALDDEQELKLAKLWARVDELEEEQYRQKERLQVVEKGLTLGLVPEELKHPEKARPHGGARSSPSASDHSAAKSRRLAQSKGKAKPRLAKATEAEDDGEAPAAHSANETAAESDSDAAGEAASGHEQAADKEATPEPSEDASASEAASPAQDAAYQKALAAAHDQYREGRYGRAIVEYTELGKKFGEQSPNAMHLYWIAKCWENLKEYNTAKQQFEDFLKKHPGSPWAPRAKFDLGKVDWQLGLQQSALKIFRDLIAEHPYEDAAEMAKMELETLDKKL